MEYLESKAGVHIMDPINYEFTLCGDSFDIRSTEDAPELELKKTNKRIVTCPNCIIIIKYLRNIKIKKD